MVGIESLMESYVKNFERSSEAACRTALYFLLNECLTVMVSIVVPSWMAFQFTFMSIRKATCSQKIRQVTIAPKALLRPRTISKFLATYHPATGLALQQMGNPWGLFWASLSMEG